LFPYAQSTDANIPLNSKVMLDVNGDVVPENPPPSFLFVAATNVVYFALAYVMLRAGNRDGWALLLVGIVSAIFHAFPSAAAQYADTVISALFIAYYANKYSRRVKNVRMFALSVALFSIGTGLLFAHGLQSPTLEYRESPNYVCGHSAWHVLSAFSAWLLLRSTQSS
jgi:hypothetical protein